MCLTLAVTVLGLFLFCSPSGCKDTLESSESNFTTTHQNTDSPPFGSIQKATLHSFLSFPFFSSQILSRFSEESFQQLFFKNRKILKDMQEPLLNSSQEEDSSNKRYSQDVAVMKSKLSGKASFFSHYAALMRKTFITKKRTRCVRNFFIF